ncbi:hypothetical protein AB0I54_42370 [Streptomyces sp. NPDC050625]|uniref:hypothetical protein n=1 Tax=Streptomyces sp. NPDC050625 TaxID=3154629 RepID=UPI003428BDE7
MTLTAALAGCGSGGDKGAASTPVSSATPSRPVVTESADPQAAEKAAVLKAYRGMTAAEAKAYRKGSEEGTGLAQYATLDALGQTRLDLARMKEAGTVVRGEVGHDPKVTSLDLKAGTPKATLSDCIDLSRYQTYDTRAKKVIPLPTSRPLRYLATAKAERWKGRWMVTDFTPQGDWTC